MRDRHPGTGPTGTTTGRPNPHTDTGFSHATKATKTHTSGNGNTTTTKKTTTGGKNNKTPKTDKPRFVPSIAYHVWQGVKNWGDDYNQKKREKFARDEGLYREYAMSNQGLYNTKSHHGMKSTGSPLDVMSKTGKDYLKDAGYGPFQGKPDTGGGGEGQRCPDGTMPPCAPQAASTPAVTPASTTPKSTWQLYPEDSDYITGKGYDTGGGVRKGPPPKRGPNPQVPPLLFSRGGGAAIRGTKFKGVK